MHRLRYLPISASLLLAVAGGAPALAQTQNLPWVQMESMSMSSWPLPAGLPLSLKLRTCPGSRWNRCP